MLKKVVLAFFAAAFVLFAGALAINIYMVQYARPYLYHSVTDLPERYVVIIPGAKVYQNTVSHIVQERVEGAVSVCRDKKAVRYLVSGDHGRKEYDEVNGIKNFMQSAYAVDADTIFLDHAGFSTYETLFRARDVFAVDNAVIVTQKFHLARAVYIGRKLGIDVVGLEAPELFTYRKRLKAFWNFREFLARIKAFFEVLLKRNPTYLGEAIPITGSASATWD